MTYFPESVIIITEDDIQFKTFSNEHPDGFIIAKPKYIPTDEIFSNELPKRSIFNKKVNRIDFWTNQKELNYYLDSFCRVYPNYKYYSEIHKNWFFAIPKSSIKQIFEPKEGLKTLMNLKEKDKNPHLNTVINFVNFILESKISLDDLGITFSTLVGNYDQKYSDINIVIYGKDNAWKILNFLKKINHPSLKWKTEKDWERFRNKRNRSKFFEEHEFFEQMSRKKTEGFFENKLFVLFPVEKETEIKDKWGDETYTPLGLAEIEGIVKDNYSSIVRPGFYEIKNSKLLNDISNKKNINIKKIVFYSRDYVMQVYPGEKIKACGLLEEVKNKNGKKYHRIVIGYFDSYLNERRDKEYLKKID